MDTYKLRQDYNQNILDENNINTNPFIQFEEWFKQCIEFKIYEPYAMSLATVDSNNCPHVRIVLMRKFDENGFCFFTNYNSNKGQELAQNNQAELLFFWQGLERQVRITGLVHKLPYDDNNEYFKQRPLASQIGAISSPQSKIIIDRQELEQEYEKKSEQYSNENLPNCPEFWGGYCVVPYYFEFWQGRASRLHDRIAYKNINNNWEIVRLAP